MRQVRQTFPLLARREGVEPPNLLIRSYPALNAVHDPRLRTWATSENGRVICGGIVEKQRP